MMRLRLNATTWSERQRSLYRRTRIRTNLDDVVELLEVVYAVFDKGRESDGGEVANGAEKGWRSASRESCRMGKNAPFIGSRVLDDLRAEIRRLDRTEVALVRFL